MAWSKDKTILTKQLASLILSNINPDKCIDKFTEFQEELFPDIKWLQQKELEQKRKYLESMRGKVIYIYP